MQNDIVNSFIEVRLFEEEDFLKVKETLTRMGVGSNDKKKLYQSCHILHKRGKYYIVHFKELFILDGKTDNFSVDDKVRRNSIAKLLSEFGLVEIVNEEEAEYPEPNMRTVKVIRFKDKDEWELVPKYTVGK